MKSKIILLITLSLSILSCKTDSKNKEVEKKDATVKVKKDAIKVIPIQHASLLLEANNKTIYIDPTGGLKAYEGKNKADMILITDIHGDHMNIETLTVIETQDVPIIVPQAVAEKLPAQFTDQLHIINNGESFKWSDIIIEAIPMYNLRDEALKFHTKGRGNGYIITLNGERIYISGDTEDIPEMRNLKNIDRAFICMNLPYTMTPESAASAVLDFSPKKVYPYHYRGTTGFSSTSNFEKIITSKNKNIEVIRLNWYKN